LYSFGLCIKSDRVQFCIRHLQEENNMGRELQLGGEWELVTGSRLLARRKTRSEGETSKFVRSTGWKEENGEGSKDLEQLTIGGSIENEGGRGQFGGGGKIERLRPKRENGNVVKTDWR